jgi:hypothetical protein
MLLSAPFVGITTHDWEGYQVRIGADGDADARASSHHGFN